MNKLIEFIEEKMVPKVSKITNLNYFIALRSGFLVIMPLTIIGSLFLLIMDFPIPGYSSFMTSIFGSDWSSYLSSASKATFDMLGLFTAGTFAYKLAETYKMDSLSNMILAMVSYIVVTPKEIISETNEIIGNILPFNWLGTKGVITAMIVAVLTVEVTRFCERKNFVIKMPESVPEMVSKAFSSLIPGFLVVSLMLTLGGVSTYFFGSLHELIYGIIQIPLQGFTSNIWVIAIVGGLNGFLWWFGIHPTVVNSIMYPLLNANSIENLSLYQERKLTFSTGNVGTTQMLDQFATIGGAGITLGLVIAMLIVAKSSRLKAMSKLGGVPSLFNINEPLVFGLPIMFNPLLLIPVTLAPVVSVLIAYFAMAIGFMPIFNGVLAPWTTPPIVSGFLVAGWQGAIVQVIAVAVSVVIYYPFVKALDQQYLDDEKVAA